jgi:glycerol-3-phosphate O-acyltransferase
MALALAAHEPLRNEPAWPHLEGRRVVFLVDACSELEARLLQAWIERNRPESVAAGDYETIRIPPTRRRRSRASLSRLDDCLASAQDVMLAPLRVAWLPRKRGGERAVRMVDLLRLGDPRDPGPLRQSWLLRAQRDRCRIVAGEPAPMSELRERWQRASGSDPSQTTGLAEFVARQASLALERGERRLRGNRYKVPRLVHQDILGQPSFRGGITQLSQELGRRRRDVENDASRYLREIAATHSPFVIDLAANLIRGLYTLGYGEALHYDRKELRRVKSLSERYPVVFLPSHKSNLDHLVLQYALHEQGHAPNHTAGGINMNFFPVGPIVRRSGVFFIRRSFKDNPVYKFVLHAYIDFLIEKRFSLEWYIEGGRSRSGKLLPPRFGLLAYVVDAFRRGKTDDVMLIPTSIAYDQIQDVGSYAAEQQGLPKQKESFGWFLGVVRRLHRRYGDIHMRFGEPVALSKVLGRAEPGAEPSDDIESLAVQKLAFEVAARINRVTPITPASLVTLSLLGVGDQALTMDEIRASLDRLVGYVRQRELPHTLELDQLDDEAAVKRALDALADNDVVSRFSEGPEDIYRIGPDEQIEAAYYANTVIHFFVNPAIAELALLRAAEHDGDRVESFWDGVMRLRDLLKFEFFFSEKDIFRGEIAQELALVDGGFERILREGPDSIQDLLRSFRPFHSHRVLRPFFAAYGLVMDHMEQLDPDEPIDHARCVDRCMRLGKQYLLQRRIHSAASVSQVLIQTALQLAENQDLLVAGAPELRERRREFAEEIRDVLRRIDAVDALAAARRARLID